MIFFSKALLKRNWCLVLFFRCCFFCSYYFIIKHYAWPATTQALLCEGLLELHHARIEIGGNNYSKKCYFPSVHLSVPLSNKISLKLTAKPSMVSFVRAHIFPVLPRSNPSPPSVPEANTSSTSRSSRVPGAFLLDINSSVALGQIHDPDFCPMW